MPQTHGVSVKPVIRGLQRIVLELQFFDAWLDNIFPFFWHRVRLAKDAPRHHRFPTFEYEHPRRYADAHVIRLVGHFALVFGRWHEDRLDEDEAPALAAQAHPTELTDKVRYDWKVIPLEDGQ